MSFPVSKLNTKRLRKTRGEKKLKAMRPQLTSLIDVMTILLIYLLKSFSAEGEVISMSEDLMLPESSARKKPELTVVIVVNNSKILVENNYIASIDNVLSTDDMLIRPLAAWLRNRRERTEKISEYSDKTEFKGDITIQGDKRIRFRLLKKIMYTCGQEGYNNFHLAVLRREG